MMRTIVILFLSLVTCFSAFSQDAESQDHLGFTFGVGFRYLALTGVDVDEPSNIQVPDGTFGKSLRLYAGYHVMPKLNIGIGFGADRYEKVSANTFPLVLRCNYYLQPNRKSFLVFAEGGTQVKFSDASDKGFVFATGIGKDFVLSSALALRVSCGYNYQKTTDEYLNFGKVTRQSLLLGLGLNF